MKNLVLTLIFIAFSFVVAAEGTKEIRPDSTQYASFLLEISKIYTRFGQYGAPSSQQIKIRISSTSETFFFGMNNQTDAGNFVPNVGYRIIAPSGDIIYSSPTFPLAGEPGKINSYKQVAAGPKQLGNPEGYDGIQIFPDQIGDYAIEFDTIGIFASTDHRLNLQYFDVTVADATNKPIPGRLHSQGWQISASNFDTPFNGKVFTYDGGTAVYKVDFNRMRPWIFVTNFNSTGTGNTGDFLTDRQSVVNNHTNPEYEVFLNPPDSVLYPVTKKEVHLFGKIKKQNCAITEFCFAADSPGYLDGFLDFNNNGIYDASSGEILFGQYIANPNDTVCIEWDGKDKNDLPINTSSFKVLSKFGFGITHLPVYDVEYNQNGLIVDRVRPPGPRPALFWDDAQIPLSVQNMNVTRQNLSGCSELTGCHRWTWNNTRVDTIDDYGNNNTINTWWYSSVVFDTLVYDSPFPGSVLLSYSPNSFDHKDTAVCKGDSLSFFIYQDGANHFNNTNYNYAWTINGASATPDIREQKQKIESYMEVAVVATNKTGPLCASTDTLRVNVINPVTISSTVNINCGAYPGNIDVSITSNPTNAVFTWEEFPSINSGTLNDLAPGQYHLSVSEQGLGKCGVDTVFNIPASLGVEIDTVLTEMFDCNLVASTTGNASVKMKDPSKQYEYSWDNSSYSDQFSKSGLIAGPHQVKVRDVNTKCTHDKTFVIFQKPLKIAVTKQDERCSNNLGSISVTLPPSDVTLTWRGETGDATALNQLSEDSYFISVRSTQFSSCMFDTIVEINNIIDVVNADFNIDPPASDSFMVGEAIVLKNSSGTVKSSIWNFGDSNTSTEYNTSHIYTSPGTYQIKLEVVNEYGCPGEVIKSIIIINERACGPALPNAFSPNGDGKNEDIGVLGEAENIDLKIFNRWGEVIFRTQGIHAKDLMRWDGIYRTLAVPIGVYPYMLEYDCAGNRDGKKRHKKVGDITLVR